MISYGTGKAGQFAKGEADRHFERMYMRTMKVVSVISLIVGILLGMLLMPYLFGYIPMLRRAPLYVYWGLIVGLIVIAGLAVKWLYAGHLPWLDKIARQRVAVLVGGQAEALVAFSLSGLDDAWHLFNGVAMKGGGDIDHVLVGPAGLFCVSTKSQKGLYAIDATGRLTLNGERCDHADDAQRRAMQLRNWLEAMLHGEPAAKSIPWVQPVLANPFAHIAFPSRRSNVWVMDERELSGHASDARAALKSKDVEACVAVLQKLTGWQPAEPKATLSAAG